MARTRETVAGEEVAVATRQSNYATVGYRTVDCLAGLAGWENWVVLPLAACEVMQSSREVRVRTRSAARRLDPDVYGS